jgi:hypothetical protein
MSKNNAYDILDKAQIRVMEDIRNKDMSKLKDHGLTDFEGRKLTADSYFHIMSQMQQGMEKIKNY